MRSLPLADPGTPDLRSPGRFLVWVARGQVRDLAGAALFGIAWLVGQSLVPALIGVTLDRVAGGDGLASVGTGCTAILALGMVQHIAGMIRHRFSEASARTAGSRVIQLVARQAVDAPPGAGMHTGDIVSVGASDIAPLAEFMRMTGRAVGAVAAFVVVAALLLRLSVPLGLLVLIGVPLVTLGMGPLLRPLHHRQQAQRDAMGELSAVAVDLVHGIRVLRGLGAEQAWIRRYRARSRRAMSAGMKLAHTESVLDTMQAVVPATFTLITVGLAAKLALAGLLSPGDLVTLLGLAGFLVVPLQTATEAVDRTVKGVTAARRIVAVLSSRGDLGAGLRRVPPPGAGPDLVDDVSGLVVAPGALTVVLTTDSAAGAALADRLGGYSAGSVRLRDIPVGDFADDVLRRAVLVVDPATVLFAGRLREDLDPDGRHDQAAVTAALHAACAEDVVATLPDGLDNLIGTRGHTVSGGQRMRLVLARALLAAGDVLVLQEPTSAVDAHTEAVISRRLAAYRRGRTTVVITGSTVFTAHSDTVARLAADGTARVVRGAGP